MDSYKNAFVSILESSAARTPNILRYLSLDCSPEKKQPWRHDFLALENGLDSARPLDLRWWSLQGEGSARAAEMLDVEEGERIAAYIRSINYDASKLSRGLHLTLSSVRSAYI